ncbi:MAG: TIGR03668 family PPOX class F420-dependent oxidoreductase [Actinomycetota bacterium]
MPGPPPHFAPLLRERRGYLATLGSEGPHVVPVCFTWAGDQIWTSVDAKPKRGEQLQRLKDIEGSASVAFAVDRWDEDWSRLAWLQARGRATILREGDESRKAQAALKSKYPQYQETPVEGPVIRIDVDRWVGWSAE